jgi:light-regulated signal transduction histidine kinase (bacteriophytochrome)
MFFLADTALPDFMPHGHCYYWEPYILWSHAISDSITALAYFIIPFSLIYIYRKRKDFTFVWLVVLFSIFIFGCGITHVFDVITIWNPMYQADSVARIITAGASIATAIALVKIVPNILSIPSSHAWIEVNRQLQESNDQLVAANEELQTAIEELRLTNEKLSQTNLELDRTNHELSRANQDLDRSNQELERFASVASHDLQEPLRKVKAFSSMLTKEYMPMLAGNGVMYLERMEKAVSRMQQLIDDLLSYSRITRQTNPFATTDLNQVVANVIEGLELKITETQAQVEVRNPLPVIFGSSSQMEQVFANLLNNALKFVKPGTVPHIRIETNAATTDEILAARLDPYRTHEFMTIRISDNGIGFDPAYAETIFGIFERLHGRSEYEGSGIGLSICRRVIENHGGRIYATSQPDQGSVFTIVLPASPEWEDKSR